jgi:TatD DNase family protein
VTNLDLVDTHAHLDDPEFDHDRDQVYVAAAAAGVRRIINVGFRPDRWVSTLAMSRRYPGAQHMLGLHPQHADEWTPEVMKQLVSLLRTTSPVAVGEIGFDYSRDGPPAAQQRAAFNAQAAIALELDLPMVIHQRAAEPDTLAALAGLPSEARVLLHSFEGTSELAKLVNDRRFFVGVGGRATRANAVAVRQTLSTIPIDRIVVETDSPYQVPAGVKQRRNAPANIPLIVERLAPIWNVGPETFAAATTENAERLFGSRLANGHRCPTESVA